MDNTPVEDIIFASANGTKNISIRQYAPALSIVDIKSYTDAACTQPVTLFNNDHTYYVKIIGSYGNLTVDKLTFQLTTSDTYVTITPVGLGVFKLTITDPPIGSAVTLIAHMSYGMAFVNGTIIIAANGTSTNNILEAVSTGDENEVFTGVVVDQLGNIICCGTIAEVGTVKALVVKFDNSFNVIWRYVSDANHNDAFYAINLDRWDRIVCVGFTQAGGVQAGLVVRLDPMLKVTDSYTFSNPSTLDTVFHSVATDYWGNIFCAGGTSYATNEYQALIVKLDMHFVLQHSKAYGAYPESCFFGVAVDNYGLVVCVGVANADALVVKFDIHLIIREHTVYRGNDEDQFNAVAIDNDNNIICVGFTYSEGTDGLRSKALAVKFDTVLKILIRKTFSGLYDAMFVAVATDIRNNIICVGNMGTQALVVKCDTNINSLAHKEYGGRNVTIFNAATVCYNNNIIIVGQSEARGENNDGIALKFLPTIPFGGFLGSTINFMTLTDVDVDVTESVLTLDRPTLPCVDSGLEFNTITLNLTATSSAVLVDNLQ